MTLRKRETHVSITNQSWMPETYIVVCAEGQGEHVVAVIDTSQEDFDHMVVGGGVFAYADHANEAYHVLISRVEGLHFGRTPVTTTCVTPAQGIPVEPHEIVTLHDNDALSYDDLKDEVLDQRALMLGEPNWQNATVVAASPSAPGM